MIAAAATTHFALQKLFTVRKVKHLRTEHGLIFFKQIVNDNNLIKITSSIL